MCVNNRLCFFPYDDKSHQWPQILAIFMVSLTGFTCGALFTWTSPSIPILISNNSAINIITLEEASYFTVIPPVTSLIVAPLLAFLVDIIGRRKLLAFIPIPQFAAWIMIAFAEDVYVFYVSRMLTGLANAIIFIAITMYIPEISQPSVRGSWGNLIAINLHLGQCLINIAGAYFTIKTTALIFSVLPVICALLMLWLPESPYFLLMNNKKKEAQHALQKLRWQENVQNELHSLDHDVHRQISEAGSIKDIFITPVHRKAIFIAIGIKAFQQLSGISAFAVYTQYLFNQAGGHMSGSTSAIIYSAIFVVATTVFAFFVERFGRRKLMTYSSFSCAVVLAIEAGYFYIKQETNLDISEFKWIPLVGMLIYIVVYSAGLAIIPSIMVGELFSASIKSKACCILKICLSVYILFVSKLFQSLTSNFGLYMPFGFFSICCFISTIFSYYCIPETKGKTLEEIQQMLVRRDGYIRV